MKYLNKVCVLSFFCFLVLSFSCKKEESQSPSKDNDDDTHQEITSDEKSDTDFNNNSFVSINGNTFTPCDFCIVTSQGASNFDLNISKSISSQEYLNIKMPLNFTKGVHDLGASKDYSVKYFDGSSSFTTKNNGSGTITILKATYDEKQFIDTLYLDFSLSAKDLNDYSVNINGELRLY